MWHTTKKHDPHAMLAGMAYHGGQTRDHWRALVGVDPAGVAGIVITAGGACYWTNQAEAIYQRRAAAVAHNFALLGIPTH